MNRERKTLPAHHYRDAEGSFDTPFITEIGIHGKICCVTWNGFFFCSKRCQLIDLGEWAAEEKAIPSDTADFAMDPNLSDEWSIK